MTERVKLESSIDFYDEVVKSSYDEFVGSPSSFRTAFNLVSALFHMHEWVYEFDKSTAEAQLGARFDSAYQIWQHIETSIPNAKFIRDVANASKHVRLTKKTSTSMTHIANTFIQSVGYGEGGYGVGRNSAPSVMMEEESGFISLDACAKDVFQFWQKLITAICSDKAPPSDD